MFETLSVYDTDFSFPTNVKKIRPKPSIIFFSRQITCENNDPPDRRQSIAKKRIIRQLRRIRRVRDYDKSTALENLLQTRLAQMRL